MANKLTEKDLEMIAHLLTNESLCCKKAKLYSNTLMDSSLSGVMGDIAKEHQERFNLLYSLISK